MASGDMSNLTRAVERLTAELQKASKGGATVGPGRTPLDRTPISMLRAGIGPSRMPRQTGPVTRGAMAAGGGGLGGLAGRLGGMGSSIPGGLMAMTGMSASTLGIGAAAAAAGSVIGGGLVNANRPGGSFQAGAISAADDLLAKIPILGELSGAAGRRRVEQGAVGDLNAITNQVARFGGADAISPKVRRFLAETQVAQNKNIEADRQANIAAAKEAGYVGSTGEGGASADMKALREEIQQTTQAFKAMREAAGDGYS